MDIELTKHEVTQGNGNGKSIVFGSNEVLATSDLGPCIAILVVDKNGKKCHMIHSDSNTTSGIGATSLVDGLKRLGISNQDEYDIGLIGGMDQNALESKEAFIEKLLPKANIIFTINADSAYITGSGVITSTKAKLAREMHVDNIIFKQAESSDTTDSLNISGRMKP